MISIDVRGRRSRRKRRALTRKPVLAARPLPRCAVACSVFLCALHAVRLAHADEDGRASALVVTSVDGCPTAAEVVADVARRLPEGATLAPTPGTARVSIELAREGDAYVATLRWPGEAPRVFHGPMCSTVARAAVLSTSMVFREHEGAAPGTKPTSASTPAASAPPSAAAVLGAPSASSTMPNEAAPSAPAQQKTAHARVTYGAVGRFFGAAGSPNVAVGGAIEAGLDRDSVLSPAIRATLTQSFASYPDADPSARIVAALVAFDVCPLRFSTARAFAAPCLGLELGNVSFTAPNDHADAFWLAPTVLARAGVSLVGPLGVEVAVGMDFPLGSLRFYREPEPEVMVEVYASFPVGFVLESGLMLTFP